MIKLLREHWVFIIILIFGIFLRSYKALDWFMYSHDQDLQGWVVKDILESKHLRLIGQETSSRGVFIGPLFYYLLIPLYLLFGMDPKGTLIFSVLLSGFAIFSIYYVLVKVFKKNVGLIATLIYSLSTLIIFTDREVAPTMPAMLWTMWFLYCLYLISKGDRWWYVLLGFLVGIAWNINLALVILLPLVPLTQFLSPFAKTFGASRWMKAKSFSLRRDFAPTKRGEKILAVSTAGASFKQKINWKFSILGLLIFLFTFSPYLMFEIRHDFQQTKAIFSSVASSKDYIPGTSSGLPKLDRVMQLVYRNTTSLFWPSNVNISVAWSLYSLILIFGLLVYKKVVTLRWAAIFLSWQVLYVAFFTFNAINPSEYYLNGMNVVWILIYSLFVVWLLRHNTYNSFGVFLLAIFAIPNLYGFFSRPTNKSGYIERTQLVKFIAQNAEAHDYPCISISYITSPGNDLGYRYLFWIEKLHVNQPKSGSPVYTIVYPHSKVERIDRSFGALGLVLPDYERYNQKDVEKSCSGANSNLTDPMFGYTE